MARIEYDDAADFLSDTSEFELFGSEEEALAAVENDKFDFEGLLKSEKCRRMKPCRRRRCYINSQGQYICVTSTTYCCVEP